MSESCAGKEVTRVIPSVATLHALLSRIFSRSRSLEFILKCPSIANPFARDLLARGFLFSFAAANAVTTGVIKSES